MTVPAGDAMFIHTGRIDQQFEDVSRLRAVETGRYVVVAAVDGVSGIVAPDGSVVTSAGARTQEVLVGRVAALDHGSPQAVWMRGLAGTRPVQCGDHPAGRGARADAGSSLA